LEIGLNNSPDLTNQEVKKSYMLWLWILIAIELAYVLSEFAFNAALLNVAGGATSDPNAFESVEKVGRLLSGIGFSLLVFGVYRIRTKFTDAESEVVALLSCAVFCVPIMYFGQKAIVDHFLINPSTVEERVDAKYISLFREGTKAGVIVADQFPFDKFDNTSPEDLTFMSIIGILHIKKDDTLSLIRAKKDIVLENMISLKSENELDSTYADYQKIKTEVDSNWNKYKKASDKFISISSPSDKEVKPHWDKYQKQISDSFSKYTKAKQKFFNYVHGHPKTRDIQILIGRSFDNLRRCYDKRACTGYKKYYHNYVVETMGVDYPLDTWCYASSRDTGGTIENKLFSDKYDSHSYSGTVICPSYKNEESYNMVKISTVLAFNQEQRFIDETGYPLDIYDINTFTKHSKTKSEAIKSLQKAGLSISNSWNGDYATFKKAVFNKIAKSSKGKWEDHAAGFGDIKPGLTYAQFLKHPMVKKEIEEALSFLAVDDRRIDYNKDQFHKKMLKPTISKEMSDYKKEFTVDPSTYADGEENEEKGKDYIRAIYIPPIALFFTLLFSLLSLSKIPLRILTIIWVKYEKEIKARWIRFIMLIDILLILGFPVLKISNKITESTKTVYLIERAGDAMGPFSGIAMKWLMNAEPILYPIGQKFLIGRGLNNRDDK
jgi:hypothetical protein